MKTLQTTNNKSTESQNTKIIKNEQKLVKAMPWQHETHIGGVALWLGRRSVAGELSLIYAWSLIDMWLVRE